MTTFIREYATDELIKKLKEKKALLVSTYQTAKDLPLCHEYLSELSLLAETLGVEPVFLFPCQLRKKNAATFISKGKLEEIQKIYQESKADLIIFDDEISPTQQKNLEDIFKCPVMDRVELILGIFAQRAQTKEAKLQVELAKLKYQYPRLKRLWTHLERQAGTKSSGAYTKGMGEKQIEVDRRLLSKRIAKLQKDIEEVSEYRKTQRNLRKKSAIPVFGIIGYTNAGKSTLINALTDAKVFVEDKLFATLDTTTRKFTLPNHQEILLVDTVGFIRKLPHLLVASFKSTLEEVCQADILLHVVDVSHNQCFEHAKSSLEVLKELGGKDRAMITVLNKIDLCSDLSVIKKFRATYPHTVAISAKTKQGLEHLLDEMMKEIAKFREVFHLRIPQKDYGVIAHLIRDGKVLSKEYEENDILISVELPKTLKGVVQNYIEKQ